MQTIWRWLAQRKSIWRRWIAPVAVFCVVAIAGWDGAGYATTGVALYGKDFAVVAVDGRINKVGPLISGHKSGCKLYVAGGKVAVVAGLDEEPDAGFDVRRILHTVLNQPGPIPQIADGVEQQIRQGLPAALQELKKKNPTAFEARAAGSSQLLLVGLDNGTVTVARRSTPYDQGRPAQHDDSTGASDHVGVALIGDTTAIDLDLVRLHNTNGWEGMGNPADLEKLARRFIALEVVAKPASVGPPITVVLLDDDGFHWVEPGACQQ